MLNCFRCSLILFAAIGCMVVCGNSVRACDTPVYRYAMYRWPAANYFVFFVHSGEATAEQKAVNAALMSIEEAEDPKPNVSFYDIPSAVIESAPPIAANQWKKIGKPQSAYIVIAPPPLGGIVYAGDLTLSDVKAMTASPARTRIASMLEEGMATVLVVLESDTKAATKAQDTSKSGDATTSADSAESQDATVSNDAAAQIVQVVIGNVRSGRLDLNAAPAAAAPDEKEGDLRPAHDITTIRVRRDDPAEKWLVRMLLAVEPDLHQFNEAMVFPVYGRGRVHPPFLRLGITPDNLGEAVQFLTGACSCTVKEENPGVDLLIDYDWESAAITMAQKFGVEEGNEQLGAVELFPELIIPSDDQNKTEPSSDVASSNKPNETKNSEEAAATDTPTANASGAPSKTDADAPGRAVAAAPQVSETTSAEITTNYSIWTVGGVLVVALGLLFAATFIILRPR